MPPTNTAPREYSSSYTNATETQTLEVVATSAPSTTAASTNSDLSGNTLMAIILSSLLFIFVIAAMWLICYHKPKRAIREEKRRSQQRGRSKPMVQNQRVGPAGHIISLPMHPRDLPRIYLPSSVASPDAPNTREDNRRSQHKQGSADSCSSVGSSNIDTSLEQHPMTLFS